MAAGRLAVVGFGPGGPEHMTPLAQRTIAAAEVVFGYTAYIGMIRDAFPADKEYVSTGMRGEVERCRAAVAAAMEGRDAAIVSSGDSGIYGMAGIVYEVADEMGADIEIEVVPGMTAASVAAAVLGAPLMHDTALISLSDLMTPYDLIMKRVDCAGQADFVIALYNPRSRKRTAHLTEAADILMRHRPPETPVGIVRHAGRTDETSAITTLGELADADVDMFSIVIVGNSGTYVSGGRMITPRGYRDAGRMDGVIG
jgi:precorrin-3B C17-methyltransferase